MNTNDTKNAVTKVVNANNRQTDRPKVSHRDRGDAIKSDITNLKKNEEVAKLRAMKRSNIDKYFNNNSSRTDKRENMIKESKDIRKGNYEGVTNIKNPKDDKTKVSEDIIKNKKSLTKSPTSKEASKNTTETNKPLPETKSPRTLKITIPNINEKKDKTKKNTKNLGRTDVKSRNRSPVLTKKASPSTEVAKWSGNKLSKPYYEAWVNFDRVSKNLSMLEKNTRLQKQLKRYKSPELMYENYTDEKFTGKIKVNYK